MEDEITTIQLKKSVVQALKAVKRYPRETYNETILRLITEARGMRIWEYLFRKRSSPE